MDNQVLSSHFPQKKVGKSCLGENFPLEKKKSVISKSFAKFLQLFGTEQKIFHGFLFLYTKEK